MPLLPFSGQNAERILQPLSFRRKKNWEGSAVPCLRVQPADRCCCKEDWTRQTHELTSFFVYVFLELVEHFLLASFISGDWGTFSALIMLLAKPNNKRLLMWSGFHILIAFTDI